jgi:hypothetical protein
LTRLLLKDPDEELISLARAVIEDKTADEPDGAI